MKYVKYDRKRAERIKESVLMTFDNMDVHNRAANFYGFIYKITKSKIALKKHDEHIIAAISECTAQLGVLFNEMVVLDKAIKNAEERP